MVTRQGVVAMMTMGTTEVWLAILMLALIIFLLRNSFLFAPTRLRPRGVLARALRYAPLAALAALVAPEVFRAWLAASEWTSALLLDARLLSAFALMLAVRITGDALIGLLVGSAVFLIL